MGYSGITAPEFEDASVALCAAVSRLNGESVWKDLGEIELRKGRDGKVQWKCSRLLVTS